MRHTIRAAAILAVLLCASPAATRAAEKAQTATGTISSLDAAHQTLLVRVGTEDVKFLWNDQTRINGVLAQGARVTVRYAQQSDGQNLAYQISVGR
jgi:hypothetical protein